MDSPDTPPFSKPDAAVVRQALEQTPQRVTPIDLSAGRRVWLKRVEQATGLMRLQKGDGLRAFVAERDALHLLHGAGVAVPEILTEGPDYFVLPDVGPNLAQIILDQTVAATDRLAAFRAAGAALAGLHRAEFAHGRPALRDMCWKDGQLRMIDLERFRNRKRGAALRGLDVVIFTHSWFARQIGTQVGPELEAALVAYRAAAPRGLWAAVGRWSRWLAPVASVANLLGRWRPLSRDWAAIAPTLAYLQGLTAAGE